MLQHPESALFVTDYVCAWSTKYAQQWKFNHGPSGKRHSGLVRWGIMDEAAKLPGLRHNEQCYSITVALTWA